MNCYLGRAHRLGLAVRGKCLTLTLLFLTASTCGSSDLFRDGSAVPMRGKSLTCRQD